MKNQKKAVLSALALGAVFSGGVFAAGGADAQGFGRGTNDGSGKAERPETRQYLNRITDDERTDRRQTAVSSLETRLAEAVSVGILTEAQRDLILQKHEELRAERESDLSSWRDLTRDERQSKIDERRADLERWAADNGIDPAYVFGSEMGGRYGRGNRA